MGQSQALTFNVTRRDPELITPAKITPNDLKDVSDYDDMSVLRTQFPIIQFFRRSELAKNKDPAKVIKEAISQALVYYYPLAGRLRDAGIGKKIFVDCTGEGVMFVEADADISLDEFGDVLHPPFRGEMELMHHMSIPLFDFPLLHFQVTRLKCGGFILATLFNHIMADGTGIGQFLTAVSEIARGFPTLSVRPVWDRHLLRARHPPQVTFEHHAFDQDPRTMAPFFKEGEKMAEAAFLFDPAAVSALRELVIPDVPSCTTFELIASAVWRARTVSLELDPKINTHLMFPVNARNKFNPPIPNGYYGNVIPISTAMATAGELKAQPITHAVNLVKKAKNEVTQDYMRSLMALRRRPPIVLGTNFLITDFRRLEIHNVDYGWGKPAFGGLAKGHKNAMLGFYSGLIPVKNGNKDEHGIAVPVFLPERAMDLFVNEFDVMMGRASIDRTWKKAGTTLFRWA